MQRQPYIWLIVGKEGKSGCLLSDNDEGLTGLFIFTTKEKAAQFVKDRKLEDTHEVVAEPMPAFEADLPKHFKSGVTHLWKDGDSESGTHFKISVLSMMMELDARPGEERK